MSPAPANIVLKSPREIDLMRAAGSVVCRVLDAIEERVAPGVTSGELDRIAAGLIQDAGGTALFLGVVNPQASYPFPASICASVNEEVVHGIPGDRVLEDGDIISVDCGVRLKGYCGDAARTIAVGAPPKDAARLLEVTRRCLDLALSEMRPGVRWSRVATKVQKCAEDAGFGVVREFVGHGIGRDMHEDPKVPNYHDRRQRAGDFELAAGMTLAVEPMLTLGKAAVEFRDKARWTVVTKDRSLAAHHEHTIAIVEDGVRVLTNGK